MKLQQSIVSIVSLVWIDDSCSVMGEECFTTDLVQFNEETLENSVVF